MARLFTVRVAVSLLHVAGSNGTLTVYEADFAGRHFSRANEADLQHWARIAARNVYGPDTQVIFLHEERNDQP